MQKITAIFLNGKYNRRHLDFYRRHIEASDYVIAADGGVVFLNSLGVVPDLLIGDGDSSDFDSVQSKEKIRHPSDKDSTDGELAVQEALKRRPENRINIYGALTKAEEADHFLGNLGILYKSTGRAVLRDVRQDIYVVSNGNELSISGNPGDIISLAAFGHEADGVRSAGLKWEVETDIPVGVGRFLRNRLIGQSVTINVRSGAVLVFHYKKGDVLSYSV